MRLTLGDGSQQENGDIWWFPQSARSYSRGDFGTPGAHVVLYNDAMTGDVVAHELGHQIFGLGDEYPEQNKSGGCGQGPSFDGKGLFAQNPIPDNSPDPRHGTQTESNNTIMQQASGQECRRPATTTPATLAGLSPGQENPVD